MQEVSRLGRRYALESELARGGMATVWRARDEVLARPVAVKILHDHLAADSAFVERFQREALAAARLAHPNIVAIYDSGTEDRPEGAAHYIVMEFCGGGTLTDLLRQHSPLAPERVGAIGSDICSALELAHAAGVVHRDLKPANVLLSEDDHLKVGDFGIAKAAFATSDITTSGMILGTVAYVSPEQAQGEEPDARSDLYSLGVLLYELLVGRPPFVADSAVATAMQHVQKQPPTPRSIRAGLPRALETVVLKALEKKPENRFESAAEMGAALRRATGQADTRTLIGAAGARAVPRRGAASSSAPRDTRWTIGVVLLVVVAVALALSFVRDTDIGLPIPGDRPGRVRIVGVSSFDPHGDDGQEHEERAVLAADGNAATTWITSQYEASLELVGKPGVGLIFDLGNSTDVGGLQITSPTPGYGVEVLAGDELGEDETGYEQLTTVASGTGSEMIEIPSHRARYWVLWFVRLPAGNQMEIAEVRFVGA